MLETFPLTEAPDWGFAEEDPTVAVTKTNLGDGYVLRQAQGINHIRDRWSPSWSSLSEEQAEATYQWLRVRKDLTAFWWVHPISGVTHQVTCTSVSLGYNNYNDYVLRAEFEIDFNPL